jgi:hypothetical protein
MNSMPTAGTGSPFTRGLELACWLKEEVGDTYRVVYEKPCENPEYQVDERREVRWNLGATTFVSIQSMKHLGFDSGILIFSR